MGISTAHSMPRRCGLNVHAHQEGGAHKLTNIEQWYVVDVHIREVVHTQRKCTCIHTQLCCCQMRHLVLVENFCAQHT